MKLFGLLPKCLGKIFNGVSHFACNSRLLYQHPYPGKSGINYPIYLSKPYKIGTK